MVEKLKKVLAAPFQKAAIITRQVMLNYLRPMKGKFLELGAGQ